MKRLLLLFAVMLSTVGAWAQTFTLLKSTDVDNPEHQYLMKNGNNVFMDAQTSYVSGEKVNGRFAFFAYGDNEGDVLIYSIDANKWVSYTKAGSYSNTRDFATLVDDRQQANPWRFTVSVNQGVSVYQFAPHNNTNIASRYMNWFEGTANDKVQNTVGLYSTNASGDNGSAWSLWPLTSQMCYLRDVRNNYLNLNQLGQDANGYENTLATLTTVPVPLYVNVAIDGRWQIHTSVDGGKYLRQSSWIAWNSQVAEGSGDYYWTIENVNADGVKYLVLKNTSGNQDGYLGNDNHTDGTPLYVNTNKDSQGVKLQILDAETEFAHITYSLDYKGENKGVEEYYSPIGKKFPKLLFAKDYIYPVMPSGNVGIKDDGRECKINLVDNFPFQVSESFEKAHWYYLILRGNGNANNPPKWIATSETVPYPNNSTKIEGDAGQWAFVGNPFDGIKVLNKASGATQTLGVDANSNVIMQDTEKQWIIQQGNGGFVLLQEQGTDKYVHDFSSKLKIWNNGSAKNDNGSAFTVKDVNSWGYPSSVTVGSKITDLSTITDGQMVVFKVADKNRYLTLTQELETVIRSSAEGLSVFRLHRNGTETNQFTIESERDGYYFPNINNSGWPDYYMTNEGTPIVYKFVNATSEANDGKFFIGSMTPYSGTTYGWFDSDDTNFTGWQGSGANATYEIYAVTVGNEASDVNQVTQIAVLTDVESGEFYSCNYLAFSGVNPTITGIPSNCIANATLSNNIYRADVTFPFPVSKDGGVTNATMISSFNTSIYKWYAAGDRIKSIQNESITNTNIATHLWAVYPTLSNSSFSFTIKNLSNGNYIKVLNAQNDHSGDEVGLGTNASSFTFENDRFKYSTGHFLSTNSSNKNDGFEQYVGTHNSASHVGSQNDFITPEYLVEVSLAKAATLYTPVAVTIPEGVTAKYVKADENEGSTGVLRYTKLEKTIPANSAVVLTGEAGDYTFTATTEAGEEVADNVLFGYATETTATDNTGIYALANKTNGVAFYPFAGTTYKAGKAYLNIAGLSTTSEVRLFNIFDEDVETAILEVEDGNVKTENSVVYDLAGRRVEKAQKGLYIINGKKVVK